MFLPIFSLDMRPNALRLIKLTIHEYDPLMLLPGILHRNTLEDIPNVEYISSTLHCGEPLWQKTGDGSFSICLTDAVAHSEPGRVVVVSDHRRWQRAFSLQDWQLGWRCPIAAIPQLSERLGYLHMHNLFIVGLLECTGLCLSGLRELQIDFHAQGPQAAMIWPPDWKDVLVHWSLLFGPGDVSTPTFARESYSHIACSALRMLVLFAVSETIDLDSQEVAFLGRALSQCQPHKQDRTVLELVGVELKEPVACTLLDQTFSAVHSDGFPGVDAHAGRNDAFWAEDL